MLVKQRAHIRIVAVAAMIFLSTTLIYADDSIPPKGFETLFNGIDLTGWTAVPEHWTVEDGELVGDGSGTNATTREEYGNFELRLEFKTVAGVDGGIVAVQVQHLLMQVAISLKISVSDAHQSLLSSSSETSGSSR